MENPIEQRKRMVQSRIEKSFMDGITFKDAKEAEEILKGIDADNEFFEKARHGVYEDNAENRRKNRVGQEYGHAAEKKSRLVKTAGAVKTVDEHAAEASDKALERAAADKNASKEVKDAAKKELQKRGGNDDGNRGDDSKLDSTIFKNGKDTGEGLSGNHPFVKKMWALDKKIENKTATPKEKKMFSKMRRAVEDFIEKQDEELVDNLRKQGYHIPDGPDNDKLDFDKVGNFKTIGCFGLERLDQFDGYEHVFSVYSLDGKKEMKEDIDELNKKLGIDAKTKDFRLRHDDGARYFEIYYNSETGEFADSILKKWHKKS